MRSTNEQGTVELLSNTQSDFWPPLRRRATLCSFQICEQPFGDVVRCIPISVDVGNDHSTTVEPVESWAWCIAASYFTDMHFLAACSTFLEQCQKRRLKKKALEDFNTLHSFAGPSRYSCLQVLTVELTFVYTLCRRAQRCDGEKINEALQRNLRFLHNASKRLNYCRCVSRFSVYIVRKRERVGAIDFSQNQECKTLPD